MNYIPHRYSPKSVHRFVPVITRVLEQHKSRGIASVSFDPTLMHISMETGIARLRDAVHAIVKGLCPHPDIDADELMEVWPLYKVTSDGLNVQVVHRSTEQGELAHPETSSRSARLARLHTNDIRFVETVTAFAVLLGQRLLVGEVDIYGDFSDTLRHRLESENDIAIIQDGPQQYHMI